MASRQSSVSSFWGSCSEGSCWGIWGLHLAPLVLALACTAQPQDCTRLMREEQEAGRLTLASDQEPSGAEAARSGAEAARIAFALEYLASRWGLKIATGLGDGEYSPYRVYINNVLTQV